MPSASIVSNPIPSKDASTKETPAMDPAMSGGDTPLGLAVQMLEKKVRNLEKRKVFDDLFFLPAPRAYIYMFSSLFRHLEVIP